MVEERGVWKFVSVFLLVLVISLPIYSANALAATVSITANHGEDNIEGYLDGQGDTWTVQTTITGNVGDVAADSVKIKIGQNEDTFDSCSSGVGGVVCTYLSPLVEGLSEAVYSFQVIYNYLDSNGVAKTDSSVPKVIKSDSRAPKINSLTARQVGSLIEVGFEVTDKVRNGVPVVGIKKVEIVDADNNVLETIDNFEVGQETFSFNGEVAAQFAGTEGLETLRVKVEDWLGHQGISSPVVFPVDFIDPVIGDELVFSRGDGFVGQVPFMTGVSVEVTEANLKSVTATSDQAANLGGEASCTNIEEDLNKCVWSNVEILPTDVVSFTVRAEDEKGNVVEKTLSKTMQVDVSPPEIVYFGSERVFEELGYVKSGRQRIVLIAADSGGAQISKSGVRANLGSLGSDTEPTSCEEIENGISCYWQTQKTFTSSQRFPISLSKFTDNVGNEGLRPTIEAVGDSSGPKVSNLELVGVSEIGEKDFFQSRDQLKLRLEVAESSGLYILVNLNGIVEDAANKYQENAITRGLGDGWQVFTQDDGCVLGEGKWLCELLTEQIKSGPDNVGLEIKVQDTAGNGAVWEEGNGVLNFELLGLSDEEDPDYWEVGPVYSSAEFVDLEVTSLAPARYPVVVPFVRNNQGASALRIEVLGCTTGGNDSAVQVANSVLYGGISEIGNPTPRPQLLLQFNPFDGKEAFRETIREGELETVDVPVQCVFNVFTKVGNDALGSVETQEVNFNVPFAFSSLGALDENLAGKIKKIKQETLFDIANKIKLLSKILDWVRWATGFIGIIKDGEVLINVVKGKTDALRPTFYGNFAATLACEGANDLQGSFLDTIEYVQVPLAVLSCNGQKEVGKDGKFTGEYVLGEYGHFQNVALEAYNVWSGRAALGLPPALSPYENIWASTIALCPAGIVYNLEKYRQVRCREIHCLQNEVPAGIATVESCKELGEFLECRYVWGNLAATAIPLYQAWDVIWETLIGWVSNPLGLVRSLLVVPCALSCPASGKVSAGCTVVGAIVKLADLVTGIAGLWQTIPTQTGDPYCGQVDL